MAYNQSAMCIKLYIQPFKHHQQMDKSKATSIWQELNGAIGEIFKKNASNLSFEHLYRSVTCVASLHFHVDRI